MTSNSAKITLLLLSLFFGFLLGEGVLRVLGIGPHEVTIPQIVSTPSACLNPHPQLGLSLNPGKFQITINEALNYPCHHLEDSTRSTRSTDFSLSEAPKPVFFFGCSLTYGMGLPDSLTFPFLVQKNFPDWDITNFAVPAYGTLQSYLQLKTQLKKGNIPALVVLNYTALHDSRNKLSIVQQKYWKEALAADSAKDANFYALARFPYVAKASNEKLNIQYLSIEEMKSRWTWSHHSALIKIIEIVFDNILDGFEDKQQISQKIILDFLATCRLNEIPVIITGISKDQDTQDMLAFCESKAIPNLSFDHDLLDKAYSLHPHDSHPNAVANQIFAQKLISFLEKSFENFSLK